MTAPKHRRFKLLVLALGLGLALACQERLAGDEVAEGTWWCSPLTSAYIIDEDGEIVEGIVADDYVTLRVCRCIPYEEGEAGIWNEEVSEEALELCLARAAELGYPDPDFNNCHERYEMGAWENNFQILAEDRDEVCPLSETTSSNGCAID